MIAVFTIARLLLQLVRDVVHALSLCFKMLLLGRQRPSLAKQPLLDHVLLVLHGLRTSLQLKGELLLHALLRFALVVHLLREFLLKSLHSHLGQLLVRGDLRERRACFVLK